MWQVDNVLTIQNDGTDLLRPFEKCPDRLNLLFVESLNNFVVGKTYAAVNGVVQHRIDKEDQKFKEGSEAYFVRRTLNAVILELVQPQISFLTCDKIYQ